MPEGRIDLTGRVAVVTGAGTGLGRSHALALAARGARVVVNDLGASVTGEGSTTSAADEVVATILAAGGDAVAEPSDVSTREGTRALYDAAVGAYGRVDILVLNAGFLRDGMFARSNIDDLDAVLAIHLHGPMYLAHHAFATMREQRFGRIVFTTSQSGVYGNIGQANYAASKSGEFGLTKTLAKEACFHLERAGKLEGNTIGITVNTVTPGYVMTEMVATIPQKVLDKIAGGIPVRRIGSPAEIARVVHFLCSDDSGYITGQIWGVNGGQDM